MTFFISTDLDGTLLDHHDYSFQAALPAIKACEQQSIPIIFNTSKTEAEVDYLQKQMDIKGNMIIENGSALIFEIDSIKPETLGMERFIEILILEEKAIKSPKVQIEDGKI